MDNEARYRARLRESLIVAFFDCADAFPVALAEIREQLAARNAKGDRACILYRTKCAEDSSPRWRVWSRLVPFDEVKFSGDPHPPWVGLDRELKRPMTDEECWTFLRDKRYEVFELRVAPRAEQGPSLDSATRG